MSQLSPMLLKCSPNPTWVGFANKNWFPLNTSFMYCLIKPDYCIRQQPENSRTVVTTYIPSDAKWDIIKYYFIPNFNSPKPFAAANPNMQIWRMKQGVKILNNDFFFTFFFLTAITSMSRTSYYRVQDKQTLSAILQPVTEYARQSDVVRALSPSWFKTHTNDFKNFEIKIKNTQRKIWPRHAANLPKVTLAGIARNFEGHRKMSVKECLNDILTTWNPIVMMTVCLCT